jgi:hypothetical protein
MAAQVKKEILFIDIVGYSKLLINDQASRTFARGKRIR